MNKNKIAVTKITLGSLDEAFGQGRFATVVFRKNDGTMRTLNGKTNVRKAVKGVGANYDARERGQIRVFDVNLRENGQRVGGYRTVTANKVVSISANKKVYELVGELKTKPEFINGVIVQGNTVRVGMNGKDTYEYTGVPTSLGLNFRDAENKGEFFNEHIKGKFAYRKLS